MKHINEELSHRETRKFNGVTRSEKIINKSIHTIYITNDELNLIINERMKDEYGFDYRKNQFLTSFKIEFLEDFAGKIMVKISWQEHKKDK